jgi:D-tyrosyl-tRNA(Tyr) deacylase
MVMLTQREVSQFTLLASTKKGSKPDFHKAMDPELAKIFYDRFVQKLQEGYSIDKIQQGAFQAMMEVALVNDGPASRVHIILSR